MDADCSDQEIIGLSDSPDLLMDCILAADNPELYYKKSFLEDPCTDITISPKPCLPDSELHPLWLHFTDAIRAKWSMSVCKACELVLANKDLIMQGSLNDISKEDQDKTLNPIEQGSLKDISMQDQDETPYPIEQGDGEANDFHCGN